MSLKEKNFPTSKRFLSQHIVDADVIIEVSADVCYYGFKKNHSTIESQTGWAIMKETVSTPSGIDSKTVRSWANGSKEFDKIMDNYASYTY